MDNLKFIRGFGKITVKKACENCKLNRSNVLNGYLGKEKEEMVTSSAYSSDFDRTYVVGSKQQPVFSLTLHVFPW